jgi:hypothetical protein
MAPGLRLEQYTLKRPQEVLVVSTLSEGEADEVLIFRGFSSSLMRPTAADPEVPVIPESAEILAIDVLLGPYTPANPQFLHRGLTWDAMLPLLEEIGV